MAKSANIYVKIEPDIKEQAEEILTKLGIPVSLAITIFYKQIIFHKGLPFDLKLPPHPLDISKLSKEELDKELKKGMADIQAGNVVSAEEAEAFIRQKHGI